MDTTHRDFKSNQFSRTRRAPAADDGAKQPALCIKPCLLIRL